MALERYVGYDQNFDPHLLEQIILRIGDEYQIRISWTWETAAIASALTIAGGVVGHYAGGKLGAAIGAGLGSATGLAVSTLASLREIWSQIKEQLQELLYIIFNYLRRLDAIDYINAFQMIMTSNSKAELVYTIVEFIATKLGREVFSTLAAA